MFEPVQPVRLKRPVFVVPETTLTEQKKPDEKVDESVDDSASLPEEQEEVESEDQDSEDGDSEASESESTDSKDVEEQELGDELSDLEDDLFLSPDDDEGEVVDLVEGSGPDVKVVEIELGGGEETVAESEVDILTAELDNRQNEIVELEKAVEEITAAKEEINAKMLRVAADLENYRRRSEREKTELKRYGIDRVVVDLIPAVDNMERALNHAEERGEDSPLVEGIEMVYRQFISALKKHGVEGFESKGDAFDPQRHEAIQQVETTEEETGTIMEQYQKGYFLHDRLLRPALVSVAKRIEAPEDDENTEEEEDSSAEVELDEVKENEESPEEPHEQGASDDEPAGESEAEEDESEGESDDLSGEEPPGN